MYKADFYGFRLSLPTANTESAVFWCLLRLAEASAESGAGRLGGWPGGAVVHLGGGWVVGGGGDRRPCPSARRQGLGPGRQPATWPGVGWGRPAEPRHPLPDGLGEFAL